MQPSRGAGPYSRYKITFPFAFHISCSRIKFLTEINNFSRYSAWLVTAAICEYAHTPLGSSRVYVCASRSVDAIRYTENIRVYQSSGIIHYNVSSVHFTSLLSFSGLSVSLSISPARAIVFVTYVEYTCVGHKKLTNDDWTTFFWKRNGKKIMDFHVKWAEFHFVLSPTPVFAPSHYIDLDYLLEYWKEI